MPQISQRQLGLKIKNIAAYQGRQGVSIELPTAGAMRQFGAALSTRTRPRVLLLSGPLGSGKTTLVRGLLRALGVSGPVTSPTFTLRKDYRPKRRWGAVVHIDAYRLARSSELAALDLKQAVSRRDTLVAVEWPERLPVRWTRAVLRLRFSIRGAGRAVRMTIHRSGQARPRPRGRLRRQRSSQSR